MEAVEADSGSGGSGQWKRWKRNENASASESLQFIPAACQSDGDVDWFIVSAALLGVDDAFGLPDHGSAFEHLASFKRDREIVLQIGQLDQIVPIRSLKKVEAYHVDIFCDLYWSKTLKKRAASKNTESKGVK